MKKKNIVFMMDIKLTGNGRWSASRSDPYKYSISSWKKFCEKYDAELFVLNELLLPTDSMGLCWQRYYLFDLLEQSNIKYDQVIMVDADTIVHPDCPNIFRLAEKKFTVARFDGSWDWVIRSIENYSHYVFEGEMINVWDYFDAGFMVVNESHKTLFSDITNFYVNNDSILKEIEKLGNGTDQTVVNFLVQKSKEKINFLDWEFNANDMVRKEILNGDMLHTKLCYNMQFNAIPNNNNNQATNYWMKRTYEYLYGKL